MNKPFQIAGTEAQLEPVASAIKVYQTVCTTWLRRRTEDMQIGMEAAKSLSECRDINQAASIYSKWVSESVNRLQEELASVTEQNSVLGNQYMTTLSTMASAIPDKVAQFTPAANRRVG